MSRRESGTAPKRAVKQSGNGCSCTALRKATRRVSLLYDMALSPSGLKITQRAILAQIRRSEPATVGALAEALVLDPGGLAHALRPLERDGFITVTIDRNDRRNRLIRLTASGADKLGETDALWAKAQSTFDALLGHPHSGALGATLQLLVSDDFAAAFEESLSG